MTVALFRKASGTVYVMLPAPPAELHTDYDWVDVGDFVDPNTIYFKHAGGDPPSGTGQSNGSLTLME